MSGVQGVEIVETGLRPEEKLYEELIVKTEELEKIENDLIFIEQEDSVTMDELEENTKVLKGACEADKDDGVQDTMRQVVSTFRKRKDVNREAIAKVS